MTVNSLPAAPASLYRGAGRPAAEGRYAGAIDQLDTTFWDGQGVFSRRRWQRKGWVYLGTVTPQQICGVAVVDAGWIATAFAYLYDRDSGERVEEKIIVPWGFGDDFAPDWRGAWRLRQGPRSWSFSREGLGWTLAVRGKALSLDLRVDDHGRGLSALSTPPGRPFHHTYKLAGLAAAGEATLNGRAIKIDGRSNLDFSLGYPPRETRWNWASLDGVSAQGTPVALNLVAHFMNGLENAIWWGDSLEGLPQAVFEVPVDRLSPWRIRTADGGLDLRFIPEGQRAESLRLGFMASVFQQPFGRFEGEYRRDGQRILLSGQGVVEDHYARW